MQKFRAVFTIFLSILLLQLKLCSSQTDQTDIARVINLTHYLYPKIEKAWRASPKAIPDPCFDYKDKSDEARLIENKSFPKYVKNVVLNTIKKFKKYNFFTGKLWKQKMNCNGFITNTNSSQNTKSIRGYKIKADSNGIASRNTSSHGAQGMKGDQDIQGMKGDDGQKGKRGESGEIGIQGIQGPQGPGVEGPAGKGGNAGQRGLQGPQGIHGNDALESSETLSEYMRRKIRNSEEEEEAAKNPN